MLGFPDCRFSCIVPFLVALQLEVIKGKLPNRLRLHTFVMCVMHDLAKLKVPARFRKYVEGVTNARLSSQPVQVDLRLGFVKKYWPQLGEVKRNKVAKVSWFFQKDKVGRSTKLSQTALARGIADVMSPARSDDEDGTEAMSEKGIERVETNLRYYESESGQDSSGKVVPVNVLKRERRKALQLVKGIRNEWRSPVNSWAFPGVF
jgi:hypothetical protein